MAQYGSLLPTDPWLRGGKFLASPILIRNRSSTRTWPVPTAILGHTSPVSFSAARFSRELVWRLSPFESLSAARFSSFSLLSTARTSRERTKDSMASWAGPSLLFTRLLRKQGLVKETYRLCSQKKIPTIQEAIDSLFVTVGGQKVYKPGEYDRTYLESILPKTQEELPPRKLSDSYGEVIVPIGSDELLREKYLNPMGAVRFGRILEDLDVFAVWLCYKHVYNPKQKADLPSPFCVVTALVDQINLAGRSLLANQDIKLSGSVSWVGSTSIETTMQLQQKVADNQWKELIQANFVMVARDPLNRGSAVINPVIAETPEEKVLVARGEVNKSRRLQLANKSLFKSPPSEDERAHIHDLYLSTLDPKDQSYKSRILPEGRQWMNNAELKTTLLCHPQERNRFNKIFGGFIMRQAFELAWVNSFVHCKTRPIVTNVDDIVFRKPVEIGSVLCFTSQVVYAEGNFMQVKVNADVVDPETSTQTTTNVFHFTFTTEGTKPIPKVVPMSYSESMMYLDGKRHFEIAMGNPH